MKGFLRKVYSKKGSRSLIFNLPLDYAKNKGIVKGDYLTIIETKDEIIIKKTEFSIKKTELMEGK